MRDMFNHFRRNNQVEPSSRVRIEIEQVAGKYLDSIPGLKVRDRSRKLIRAQIVYRNADSPRRKACAQRAIAGRHFKYPRRLERQYTLQRGEYRKRPNAPYDGGHAEP